MANKRTNRSTPLIEGTSKGNIKRSIPNGGRQAPPPPPVTTRKPTKAS